jgi:hypothetical protein
MRKLLKISAYFFFLLIAVFVLCEIILRFWNPFEFRQGDNDVILPRNRKMVFTNSSIPGLDNKITHTKNSLGFRGPEPPENINEITSVIAVGGSTTECFYISDSMCWTNLLSDHLNKSARRVWINNAGYQGHSTYGNFILIDDYIKRLHPDYVLLMEGMNEVNRADLKKDESISLSSNRTSSWGWIKRNSRVVSVIINIQRKLMADRLGVTDHYYDPAMMSSLTLSDHFIDSAINKQLPLVEAYSKRLQRIIDTCIAAEILPVLITQPVLYGEGKDCITGTDLSTVKITEGYNGKLFWLLLELYNDKTRRIAQEKGIYLIDLAFEMPKCSRYFYDVCHFTNEGSEKVADIISRHLEGYIK